MRLTFAVVSIFVVGIVVRGGTPARSAAVSAPTFYRDILPILQQHCQQCHRPGEIAPTPLVTYEQAKSSARLVREDVRSKHMPPWFADPCCGYFSDDPSLTPRQIAAISDWVDAKMPAGDPRDAPPNPHWAEGWNISQPDRIVRMPRPVAI